MKRNPHIAKLQFLALLGIVFGGALTIIGVFNDDIPLLARVGAFILSTGVLAGLLAIVAAALSHRDG